MTIEQQQYQEHIEWEIRPGDLRQRIVVLFFIGLPVIMLELAAGFFSRSEELVYLWKIELVLFAAAIPALLILPWAYQKYILSEDGIEATLRKRTRAFRWEEFEYFYRHPELGGSFRSVAKHDYSVYYLKLRTAGGFLGSLIHSTLILKVPPDRVQEVERVIQKYLRERPYPRFRFILLKRRL